MGSLNVFYSDLAISGHYCLQVTIGIALALNTLLLAYTHKFTHICAQIYYKRHFFRCSANNKIWHLEAILRAALRIASFLNLGLCLRARNFVKLKLMSQAVAEWLRAWDTLTMFEAKVYGRS